MASGANMSAGPVQRGTTIGDLLSDGLGKIASLARLAKPLLLSLLNATLALAVALSICIIVLIGRLENFAAETISDVKFGLLQEIDQDVRKVAEAMESSEQDLRQIVERLAKWKDRPEFVISPNTRRVVGPLVSEIHQLNVSISRLTHSKQALSNRSILAIGDAVANAYITVRNCRVSPPTLERQD